MRTVLSPAAPGAVRPSMPAQRLRECPFMPWGLLAVSPGRTLTCSM